jgi:POT family proton-dependent oligopeptide transporter
MVTKLAPRRMTSMLMGLWFISTSLGNWFSGRTGKWFWKSWTHAQFFSLLVVTSLVAAVVLLTQYRRLKAAMPPEQGTRAKAASDPNAVPVAAQPATAAT